MTTTFYKATRPDGTDFRTGRVLYEVGATVEHPTSKRYGYMLPNNPGTYLSVSVEPGETLIGGHWPCRLFRVEPVGRTVKRTDGDWPYKRGCRALRVVEELPAHVALGPNGEHVAALIERARTVTFDEAQRLRAAWAAARGAVRYAARDAVWDAARDAALALLVRDLVSGEEFRVLYGPWASVMGDAA